LQTLNISGLWGYELQKQLLWTPKRFGTRTYTEYRAPSWSWASLDGEIILRGNEGSYLDGAHCLATVLKVSVRNAGDDPFGQVYDGRIRLQGCLWKGTRPRK